MNLEKWLISLFSSLFLFFCFFPYLDFIGLGTVTQPNALLVSVIPIVFIKGNKFPPTIYLLILVLIVAIIISLFFDFSFLTLRDLMNYVSLLLVSMATYKILKYRGGLGFKTFYAAVVTWLMASVLQVVYRGDVFSFMLYKVRGLDSGNRGLTSLSTEPTYYGLIMGLFLVIYFINGYHHRSKTLGALIVIQIFIVAQSSTVLAITLASLGIFLFINVLRLKLKYLVGAIATVLVLGLTLSAFSERIKETRMYELTNLVAKNPELVFKTDFSVSERINHAFFPVFSLADNRLLPGGYGTFGDYLTEKKESGQFSVLFSHRLFRGSNRILSGYGKVLFELGGLGLLVPLSIACAFWFGIRDPGILFAYIYFNLLLFAALPFMTASVPFVIGVALYARNQSIIHQEITNELQPNTCLKSQ